MCWLVLATYSSAYSPTAAAFILWIKQDDKYRADVSLCCELVQRGKEPKWKDLKVNFVRTSPQTNSSGFFVAVKTVGKLSCIGHS